MRMNTLRKFFTLVIMVWGFGYLAEAQDHVDFIDNHLEYHIVDYTQGNRKVRLLGYEDKTYATGTLTIPTTVTYNEVDYTVTEIGPAAFYRCPNLTGSLVIPNSITIIGGSAFGDCIGFNGSLTIGSSVISIGPSAFYRCSGLTGSLTIPSSVTEIGRDAFYQCSGFSGNLTMGNWVTTIGEMAFYQCSGLVGSLSLSSSLTEVNKSIFCGCSGFTGDLVIPNTVTRIESGAFASCSGLNGSLTIGKNVSYIDRYAFENCGFTGEVTALNTTPATMYYGSDASNPFYGVPSTTLHVPFTCGTAYGESNWSNHFTNIVEDRNVTCGEYVYYGNDDITFTAEAHVQGNNVAGYRDIPESVLWAGNDIPVTGLGDNLFSGSNIEGLTIPSTITHVGANTASNCLNLDVVEIYAVNPPTLGNNAFTNIAGNTLYVPSESVETYESSPWHNRFPNIEDLIVVFSVGTLDYQAIDGHTVKVTGTSSSYDALVIPSTVTYGGSEYTVTEIGRNAFKWKSNLTSLTLPNTLIKIGNSAFYGCSGMTGTLSIPNSVTYIGSEAFKNCSGFTGPLSIPSSVEFIGYEAFRGCTGFNSLTLSEGVKVIREGVFKGCTGFSGTLSIPSSVNIIGNPNGGGANGTFENCTGLTGELIIPNTVTMLDNYSFKGCSGFTGDLTIPNAVTAIGSSAFEDCSGMSGLLTIGSSVEWIGPDAFDYCGFTEGIVVLAEQPPVVQSDSYHPFHGIPNKTVYVPFGCLDTYLASAWNSIPGVTIVMNDIITSGSYVYHYISGNNVSVINHVDGTAASGYMDISEVMEYHGANYTVVAIEDNAFKNTDIMGVRIPNTVTSIGDNAISDCPNLILVEVEATTPPTLGSGAFYNIPCYSLTVPCGYASVYENSPWAGIFIYVYEDCQDIESAEENVFSLYPNPTRGLVKIEAAGMNNVIIFNQLGQKVFENEVSGNTFEYNFKGQTGMFLIRVETDNGVETKRVVVL